MEGIFAGHVLFEMLLAFPHDLMQPHIHTVSGHQGREGGTGLKTCHHQLLLNTAKDPAYSHHQVST
jgi:hypothetical protein